MTNKIAYRHRKVIFALVMSSITSLMVSGIVMYLHAASHANFFKIWIGAFLTAWPIVFITILVVAPVVNVALNLIVEDA